MLIGKDFLDKVLAESEIRDILAEGLAQVDLAGMKVLTIIPDGTRSGPTDMFFRLVCELLIGKVRTLDFLIALGTHQPMPQEAIHKMLGISTAEMKERYSGVRILNHHWNNPDNLRTLGVIPASEIEELSKGLLSKNLPVSLNKIILNYDQLIICGPVFPHEVVGFSGGNKYFIPGISGKEVLDLTHWLGALVTSYEIIGTKDTPVRAVIDRAASFIPVPRLCICFVVKDKKIAGLYVGSPETTWNEAANLSSKLNIVYVDRPYTKVLSVMPEMYEDIWTAAKGMYKLENVVADGGEVIIYAPRITEISYTHGHLIDQIGYHVRDYFVERWDDFKDYPWCVLAHSTHLRGVGTFINKIECPRINVTLATRIPRKRCEQLRLGYRDPDEIEPEMWYGRQSEGILVVPDAGEILYRLKSQDN